MNFDWINKNIAVGTEVFEADIPILLSKGFGAVLDMRAEASHNPNKLKSLGIVYKRIPVIDMQVPTIDQMLEGVYFLDDCMANGLKVYVHCKYGRGRSAVMVIAYLIKGGMTPIDAYQLVKERRPEADPTLMQIYGLKQFERVI